MDDALLYFNSLQDVAPKGIIDFCTEGGARLCPAEDALQPHCFQLEIDGNVFRLACTSASDFEGWQDAISGRMRSAQHTH